ncbi:MAG: lytic transglycosylase domain-containing protein [Kofleriaceae bacterium]|nr:lytic transglycosylase domain-containing protein [Myxococcales bacterium]MCB9560042.1 lytic transglycosylase domain-containing protein [Kofleriaceae bacterium]MCB9571907.1 lytic transglycosylase domain-containing protein [Kofleriaceae bacterium]
MHADPPRSRFVRGGRAGLVGLALVVAALLLRDRPAAADIYQWTDDEGVVHFTNIAPRGKARQRWKKVMDEAPDPGSKAAARRGGCDRCDVVPSRDRSPERYHRYDAYIYEASELYKIPVALIRAVIHVESDYDPHVVSSMDAKGLMQLMPAVEADMGVHQVFDPRENILGGTRLLRWLANRYDGDLVLTIAAYHAGPGSLKRYGNTVPPFKNTRLYLRMVLDRYYAYKAQEASAAATR